MFETYPQNYQQRQETILTELQQEEPKEKTYSSDMSGLHEAAADLSKKHEEQPQEPQSEAQPTPPPPELEDDQELSLREAGKRVSEKRKHLAEAFNKRVFGEAQLPTEAGDEPAPISDETRAAANSFRDEEDHVRQELEKATAHLKQLREEREATQARQQAELQEAERMRQGIDGTADAIKSMISADFERKYGQLTEADVAYIAQTNPELHAEIEAYKDQALAIVATASSGSQQAIVQQVQAHEEWGRQQDQAFARNHPELADPQLKASYAKAATDLLLAHGLDEAEIQRSWHGVGRYPLRDAATQELLMKAVQFEMGKQKAQTVIKKGLPPVQRPGVAAALGDGGQDEVRKAEAKFNRTGNVRDAAKLYAARKRARGQ